MKQDEPLLTNRSETNVNLKASNEGGHASHTQPAPVAATAVHKMRQKMGAPKSRKQQSADGSEEDNKHMVGGCCVCSDDTGFSNNLLVYCDGCNVAVHQGCYGIINVPDGDWFCRRCEFKQKNETKHEKIVDFLLFEINIQ